MLVPPTLAQPVGAAKILDSAAHSRASSAIVVEPELEAGFRDLYRLRFERARDRFEAWQQRRPDDPLGPVAEAASYLFEEFTAHDVLTSDFFLDDDRLLGGITGRADPDRRVAFLAASERARQAAQRALDGNPRDAEALLAQTIAAGMRSNFLSLIERRQLQSLGPLREADRYATRLLAVDPSNGDAYLALGASNYIIGSLPGYKRAFLWFGRITGSRQTGVEQLALAAERGTYLQPYARILLFLVSLREGADDRARRLIDGLVAEFPENPLLARERTRLMERTEGEP